MLNSEFSALLSFMHSRQVHSALGSTFFAQAFTEAKESGGEALLSKGEVKERVSSTASCVSVQVREKEKHPAVICRHETSGCPQPTRLRSSR